MSELHDLAAQWAENHRRYTAAWKADEEAVIAGQMSKGEYLRRDKVRQVRFNSLQRRLERKGTKLGRRYPGGSRSSGPKARQAR